MAAALRQNPIQYEVLGLPPGHEQIFIGQGLDVRPRRWNMPEAAVAAIQADLSS